MTGCLTERSLDYSNRGLSSTKVNKESFPFLAAETTNLQDHSKQMDREETHQKENMLFTSQEYAEKLQKENMTLMKALSHRNKIIELSGIEFQKLRINLRNVQEKNWQLAQANSQMLAELNTNRDRLKALQHELGCKNLLLNVRKQLEEQRLPHHASKDKKVPTNVSDEDCKSLQLQDMNYKDTKRKRTSRIKPVGSSEVNPIHMKEKVNRKRRASGVIDTSGITEVIDTSGIPEVLDTSGIPEETFQTEDDIKNGIVFREENQIVDNVVNKKFVLDAANLVKDSVHNNRQCTRRQSTRFNVQATEQKEKLPEMDDAKKTKETASLSLRRRSTRLRPKEAEPCKSFHEEDEVRETIKRKRVSSSKQSARCDFLEPEVTETLIADDAGSLPSEESLGSRSEAVEPSESRHDTKETNPKRRVSTRRQSTKGKSQNEEAIKEIAREPSLRNNIVEECNHETESKDKPKAEENEGMIRRTSVGRPSRHAAEKVQSYREVSLKVKLRRNC